MYPDSGLHSIATAWPISSARPTRPTGTANACINTARSTSGQGVSPDAQPLSPAILRNAASNFGDRIVPGETAFTVTPSPATALAIETVRLLIAAFAAE